MNWIKLTRETRRLFGVPAIARIVLSRKHYSGGEIMGKHSKIDTRTWHQIMEADLQMFQDDVKVGDHVRVGGYTVTVLEFAKRYGTWQARVSVNAVEGSEMWVQVAALMPAECVC